MTWTAGCWSSVVRRTFVGTSITIAATTGTWSLLWRMPGLMAGSSQPQNTQPRQWFWGTSEVKELHFPLSGSMSLSTRTRTSRYSSWRSYPLWRLQITFTGRITACIKAYAGVFSILEILCEKISHLHVPRQNSTSTFFNAGCEVILWLTLFPTARTVCVRAGV